MNMRKTLCGRNLASFLSRTTDLHLVARRIFVALVLLGAASSSASASYVTYTDRAAFLAASSLPGLTSTNQDFSVNPGNPFTITDGINSVTLQMTQGTFSVDRLNGTGNGNIILHSTAVSGLLRGIGFDYIYGPTAPSNAHITTPETGSLVGPSIGLNTFGFWGVLFLDGTTISAVTTLSTEQGFGTSKMDNIAIVTGLIPEPASLSLLALGGLALLRRHRLA